MIEQRTRHPARRLAAALDLQSLSEREWEELYLRLLLYAQSRLRRLDSSSYLEAQDYVQAAIQAYLGRERRKPEDIDLFPFLAMVIRSEITHQLNKESRQVRLIAEDESNSLASDATGEPIPDPYLRSQILKFVAGDKVLSDMISLFLEDPGLKARHLAATLGVPVREIYEANRRLKRKLSKRISSTQGTNPTP